MLGEEEAIDYWQKRASKLGKNAVGFGDQKLHIQEALYRERKDFIFTHLKRNYDTLEYGCGIGRYASEFHGNYLGVDISPELLAIAIKENPGKAFSYIDKPYLPDQFADTNEVDIECIFTATVLQHCSDELVMKILQSFKKYNDKRIHFLEDNEYPLHLAFYENSEGFEKPHVKGRKPEQYLQMVISAGFKIKGEGLIIETHTVKKEKHSLTIMQVS